MNRIIIFIILFFGVLSCVAQDKPILIINIGDELGRAEIAKLVSHINKDKPKVIGLNIGFQDVKDHDTDELLVDVLWNTKHLVVGGYLQNEDVGYSGKELDYKFFYESLPEFVPFKAKIGFTNMLFENDVVKTLKRFSIKEKAGKKIRYNFGIQIAMESDSVKTKKFINGNKKIVNVDYSKNKTYEIMQAAKALISGPATFSNKIVLIGYTGPGLGDKFFSPLNRKEKKNSTPDIYGIEYYACIISQVLN